MIATVLQPPSPLRVLLLSPYHTGSHRQWAEGLSAASRHDFTLITLPGQFWKWRLSGGAPAVADGVRGAVAAGGPPDIVLATSMTDLAAVVGLSRPVLDGIPIALYMHENQITYPVAGRTRAEHRLALISWHSMLAADAIAFNSGFHRDAVGKALPGLLRAMPDDEVPDPARLTAKPVVVLPVGVDLGRITSNPRRREDPPIVVWNHRWDPDKRPEMFLDAVVDLADEGVAFDVALAGERFAGQSDEYAAQVERLGDRVLVAEHLSDHEYVRLLRRADLVVSTAVQEFFGVAVVEAMAAGAMPILPDELVYPERVPNQLHPRCLYRGERQLRDRLREALTDVVGTNLIGEQLAESVAGFDWSRAAPRYDDWLASVAAQAPEVKTGS